MAEGNERKKVLVTGADGFVALHLLHLIREKTGWEVYGIGLKPGLDETVEGVEYEVVDITDYDLLKGYIGANVPDVVFHLAAQPSVALSWENPRKTYEVNLLGQMNLMEILRESCKEISILITCSSEEYGIVTPEEMPLVENRGLKPCSHYAVSKVAQEVMGLMYEQAFRWRVFITRGFNQAGPGQSPGFVVSSFARQIAMIEAGGVPPVIKVGNLEAERDFIDVRDTVMAYLMVMQKGNPGSVYNVCSGSTRRISEILDLLVGMSSAEITVEKDPARQRPSDIPVLKGDPSRIKEEVGWEPAIPIERTLKDTLDYWRSRV